MFLAEELFEKLLNLLRDRLGRDPSRYSFFDHRELKQYTRFLESFLSETRVPFSRVGVNLSAQSLMPACLSVRKENIELPNGLFIVFQETDKEVIIYCYDALDEPFRHGPRVIVGYRDHDVFERLFGDLKAFAIWKDRNRRVITVYGGEDFECPSLSWDDLILPDALKKEVRWHVEAFLEGESVYGRLGVPYRRGFLFSGPPGNGKTMILKVIASVCRGWRFIYFNSPSRCDNNNIDEVFKEASETAPSILCFEDLDSLFLGEVTLSHFLNRLDGFEGLNGTLVLATTNHPERIDAALTNRPSRFDRVWLINNPDEECRRFYIKKNFVHLADDQLISRVAADTQSFSMAHLKELYVAASMLAIERGLLGPGEEEVLESFQALSKQIVAAKNDFVDHVKTIGFAAIR